VAVHGRSPTTELSAVKSQADSGVTAAYGSAINAPCTQEFGHLPLLMIMIV
jgi:hypothetical protein